MSTTTDRTTSELDVVLAMCCECATTRTVKRRAVGRELRCETCGAATTHMAMMDDPSLDGREVANAARPIVLSLDDKIDVLRAMGVRVRYVDELSGGDDDKKAIASVWWYLSDDRFQVDVNGQCSDARVDHVMSQILERIAKPNAHRWFIHAASDDDGIAAATAYMA